MNWVMAQISGHTQYLSYADQRTGIVVSFSLPCLGRKAENNLNAPETGRPAP